MKSYSVQNLQKGSKSTRTVSVLNTVVFTVTGGKTSTRRVRNRKNILIINRSEGGVKFAYSLAYSPSPSRARLRLLVDQACTTLQ